MPSTIDLTNLTLQFNYYSIIFVGTIGFPTNLMNIHVSMGDELQKTNMGFYNIFLSVSNIFIIIFTCFLSLFPRPFGVNNLVLVSTGACKIIPFLARIFPQITAWLNIITSFDRLIVMHYKNMDDYRKRSVFIKSKKSLSVKFVKKNHDDKGSTSRFT